ncbi:hypothetical protein EAH78_28590 [Pseudomonas arsenicoxydans]|uniref:Uncharacterized protein n=1 Tax=Pseudomonas arsenicoxydans TaxID=702115 RepID=A0A502HH59_9PSED|nr:hypothetical protein EAH78_28590 [Pseudomonas arsenicoxydans]
MTPTQWRRSHLTAKSVPLPVTTSPMWERACSRKRCVSQYLCRLTDCIREQARSHILFVYNH